MARIEIGGRHMDFTMCKFCHDTGKIITADDGATGDYCTCNKGEMEKRLERARKRAERAKEKERREIEAAEHSVFELAKRQEAAKTDSGEQIKFFDDGKLSNPPFNLFDWVIVTNGRHQGVIGVVTEIKIRNCTLLLEAAKNHGSYGKSWFEWDNVKPLPTDLDEDDLLAMIDIALDAKDEKWFFELTNQLP